MPKTGKARGNSKKEAVAKAAQAIIRQKGHPVDRNELLAALTAAGLRINGKSPLVTLSTMLWRMKTTILHLPSFGYWDASLPYAEADYDPDHRIHVK